MPSETIAILLLIGLFIFLMAVRMPIALSIGIASMVTCIYLDIPVQMVLQNMVKGVNTYSLPLWRPCCLGRFPAPRLPAWQPLGLP